MIPDALRLGAWNLRVNRDPGQVRREVRAALEDLDLDVLVVLEAWQYADALALIPGWDLHTTRGRTPSARDAGIMVRHGLEPHRYRLARTAATWARVKAPGLHWPRSFPSVVVPPIGRVVAVHMPPRYAGAWPRAVCWARVAGILAGRRQYVAAGDWNATTADRGPFTPATLARVAGGRLTGASRIDHLLHRGVRVRDYRRVSVGGSDHPLVLATITPA